LRQQYSSYNECVDFFRSLEKKYPDLIEVNVIGKTWEDRDIIEVTLTKDVTSHKEKPALFYTGTIHAREWIGIELAIAFVKYIVEHIEYDPKLNDYLDSSSLYLVPCANPDGYEYSRNHFSFWRKNRRKNADGSFGVDLNRNFEIGFVPSKNTISNVYPGPYPFSEPETASLRDFFEEHPNISIALDYHSQGNVFFPAHNFIHEDAEDAIDLNLLAGNMAEEIRKESGREYGVHMGKPPTHLISGSGREFYYSKGALSLVAEVGTRNISDYMENMQENIDENIQALLYALSEVRNYQKQNTLSRVENFCATTVGSKEIELSWDYEDRKNIYFEIYRSKKKKGFAQASNRIGLTKLRTFKDRNLDSSTTYYYYIRAIERETGLRSAFGQYLGVRTHPAESMFSKILYPVPSKVGYVGEKTKKNKEHFGINSLFVGVSQKKGECYGVCGFSLSTVPENAKITSASISFYPMNRVAVQIEKYGEWRVGQMDERTIGDLSSFDDIKNVKMLSFIDRPTKSHQLSQGIWRTYTFAEQEIEVLQKSLLRREAYFRMEGPKTLPLDRASQLMQWDIGYGKFSGGLTYRPKLDISYTIDEARLDIASSFEFSIAQEQTYQDNLTVGYDKDGFKRFGYIKFDLSNLPDMENIIISEAYVEIEAVGIQASNAIRFHIEMIEPIDNEVNYESIKKRDVVERIGYDVSVADIKTNIKQRFVFDRFAINELLLYSQKENKIAFVISPTAQKLLCKTQIVNFLDEKKLNRPSLVIKYIKKRRTPPSAVSNLRIKIDNGIIKLEWDNPKEDGFKGVIVVKNPHKIPCGPYDGQKIYGGSDNYTYDKFGDTKVHKYYGVFSYDDVPNFSEASFIEINGQKKD